jgi:hypothetical protein
MRCGSRLGTGLETDRHGSAPHLQLLPETVDVLPRGDTRVSARVDGVLLGGQAEGVPAHGVEHVIAQHTLWCQVRLSDGAGPALARWHAPCSAPQCLSLCSLPGGPRASRHHCAAGCGRRQVSHSRWTRCRGPTAPASDTALTLGTGTCPARKTWAWRCPPCQACGT